MQAVVCRWSLWSLLLLMCLTPAEAAEKEFIPRRQDKPPGPALSPAEALARMTVPAGFSVELVVSEPDLVNPVSMTFDERGRIWVTESLEYPRHAPGMGRDRIKVFEDTDGDGTFDRTTIFAEGLNIPSGIAVGYGGVWVANAPDLLFMQDTDGDGKADRTEVILTGFGRADTHELPNSLTWGPDGWLYGLNGVFNPCHIKHQGQEHRFTCAMFRVHPRTHAFELFAEGVSNPWGIAFDRDGSAFVSACVIDHLWHLTETGYYHRQAGAYPPFTWKIGSIVNHKHQMAAYCGLHYFDSDAYPPQYRGLLYMGNIHGGCINVDRLERRGSTYHARPEPDFLTANDVWFMPIAQKTGPDGCLYILDWYDRYHCYQDAMHDPKGVDRLHGRIYRVRYQETPRAQPFDLARESDEQLIERLGSPNIYFREMAQRLLQERKSEAARQKLESLVLDRSKSDKMRRHGLFALVGAGPLDPAFHRQLLASQEPTFRAWGVRAAGNMGQVEPEIREQIAALASDPNPDVKLQVAIAARKITGLDPLPILLTVVQAAGEDPLIPQIVWRNVEPLVEQHATRLVQLWRADTSGDSAALQSMLRRLVERIVLGSTQDPRAAGELLDTLTDGAHANLPAARHLLNLLAEATRTRQLTGERLEQIQQAVDEPLRMKRLSAEGPLQFDAARLAAMWGDPSATARMRSILKALDQAENKRIAALQTLAFVGDAEVLDVAMTLLEDPKQSTPPLRAAVFDALGRLDAPQVGQRMLVAYATLPAEVRPHALELLTARGEWSKQLLAAISQDKLPASALNVNQIRKLFTSSDKELVAAAQKVWGTVRTERNPQREQVIERVRKQLAATSGDPHRGLAVYRRVCGQCHKLYGEGEDVGPEITANGRSTFDQLLSNVFDPSLVIGASYQASTIITADGRVLTGLVVEDSPQRVVLKMQGGKTETIARDDIDEMQRSQLSLMPEGLEEQLAPQELADLFALLTLDGPPSNPESQIIPGAGHLPRKD